MNLKIIKEQQNPLFNRKEIEAIIQDEVIPSKKQVAELLSKKYSVPVDSLRVLEIQGKFGSKDFILKANIYKSKEERDRIEILTKKEIEEEKKASEAKPESKESETQSQQETEKSAEEKVPAEEAIGLNPVEEAKKAEAKKAEEDKKEKDKTEEEKQLER